MTGSVRSRVSALPAEVRSEYPYSGCMLGMAEGVGMHFLDEGAGSVVVMLHGNPTWSFHYRGLVDRLSAAGYRCIVPDHIGCGLSDKPQNYEYTLRRRIEDIERLLDHLKIGKFSLIVHDWGGAIGCGLAGRRPEALEKLVLLNTAAFRSVRIPWRIAAVKTPVLGAAFIRGLNGFAGPASTMAVTKPLTPAVKRGLLWPYDNWSNRVANWHFVKDIPLTRWHRSYRTLVEVESNLVRLSEKRVAIFWGGKDFCFNRHFYERWRKIFPRAQSKWFPRYGHYILEDGGQEVEAAVQAFLDS